MTAPLLAAKDTKWIKDRLVAWINDNAYDLLPDPYFVATGNTRTEFAVGGEFKLPTLFPKIQVAVGDLDFVRISEGKTGFRRELTHTLNLFYYNKKGHKFVHSGTEYINGEQSRKYMEMLRDALITHCNDFIEFSIQTYGSIAQARFDNQTGAWVSFMPVVIRLMTRTV